MSQTMIDTFPLLPASQEDGDYPIVPPVVVAVPVKSRGRPKKPATEEEKAAAAAKEAEKAKKEAEKKAKEEKKAAAKAEKEAEKVAAKAAKEAEKAEKDANKKPRGRPKKDSPTLSSTVPAHNPADIVEITHLKEDIASDESEMATLRAEITALKNENKRLTDLLASVRSLVA